jgi:Zn-dependent peptidase ImmA (M78 family)
MLAEALRTTEPGTYLHPGQAFIEAEGLPLRAGALPSYVERYTHFLRRSAGTEQAQTPNLLMILLHFGLKVQRGPLGPSQRGFVAPGLGVILLNGGDHPARQRYTLAHELVELLFEALADERLSPSLAAMCRGRAKERLCERGAATLLMPEESVRRLIEGERPSLLRISEIARLFDVSLTAALVRIVGLTEYPTTFSIWQLLQGEQRGSYPDPPERAYTGPRAIGLRWYVQASSERHRRLPLRLRAPAGSPMGRALAGEAAFLGRAELQLGRSYSGVFHVEARRYEFGREPRVYALLTRLDG